MEKNNTIFNKKYTIYSIIIMTKKDISVAKKIKIIPENILYN
jgi:hypothetical protein